MMRKLVKRILIEVFGWGFILLGIVGLFLPVLQGVLFILIGMSILSVHHHWARNLLTSVRRRFPRASALLDQASAKARGWLDRLRGKPVPSVADQG